MLKLPTLCRGEMPSGAESDDLPRIDPKASILSATRWNQYPLGKTLAHPPAGGGVPIPKKNPFRLQQKMAVHEKAEPKLIVGEIAETERNSLAGPTENV